MLGSFETAEEAARAYDRALIKYGLFIDPGLKSHVPNFPLKHYLNWILQWARNNTMQLLLKINAIEMINPQVSKEWRKAQGIELVLSRLRSEVHGLSESKCHLQTLQNRYKGEDNVEAVEVHEEEEVLEENVVECKK